MNNEVILEGYERDALSCMILDNTLIDRRRIQPRHFSNVKHKKIFEAILNLREKDKSVDIITLHSETQITITELSTIADSTPSIQLFESLEEQIFKLYSERNTLLILEEAKKSYLKDKNLMEVKKILEKLDVYENFEGDEAVDINEVFERNYEEIEKAYLNKGKPRGVLTGINNLDHYTNGVEKGNVTVIAARPGVGKTGMVLSCALNMSKTAKVLLFSLEMTKEQVGYRIMSQLSKVPARNISNGALKEETLVKMLECSGKVEEGKLSVFDKSQSIEALERNIAYYVMKHGVDVVIIDYLSLIENTGGYNDENGRLTHIINRITTTAKKMNVGIICLAQLNRESEKSYGEPKFSHLKDCGAIEQYASVIIGLTPDMEEKEERKKYNIESDTETLYAYVMKNRNGERPNSPIVLDYNKPLQIISQR